jgi:hypothetical protein
MWKNGTRFSNVGTANLLPACLQPSALHGLPLRLEVGLDEPQPLVNAA